MSNRQERRARKARQRAGLDVYVHVRPTKATRPYETRRQAQARRRAARVAEQAAAEAARLAIRAAPAARAAILAGGRRFGEDA